MKITKRSDIWRDVISFPLTDCDHAHATNHSACDTVYVTCYQNDRESDKEVTLFLFFLSRKEVAASSS